MPTPGEISSAHRGVLFLDELPEFNRELNFLETLMAARKSLKPRYRLMRSEEIALGPGKAGLLEAVAKTGSIAEAARQLDFSYMRAWSMIKTMNQCFQQPVVEKNRGGEAHGGAAVTDFGQKVLKLYRQLEARAHKATAKESAALLKLLR